MIDDREPEAAGVGQRAPEEGRRSDRGAVVAEPDDARLGQRGDRGEMLACSPGRRGPIGEGANG